MRSFLQAMLSRLHLPADFDVVFSDGSHGGRAADGGKPASTEPALTMRILDRPTELRLALNPELALGEAVMDGRLKKARAFRLAAECIVDDGADSHDLVDVYVTLCVHAGIAGADVCCAIALGKQPEHERRQGDTTRSEQIAFQRAKTLQSGHSPERGG